MISKWPKVFLYWLWWAWEQEEQRTFWVCIFKQSLLKWNIHSFEYLSKSGKAFEGFSPGHAQRYGASLLGAGKGRAAATGLHCLLPGQLGLLPPLLASRQQCFLPLLSFLGGTVIPQSWVWWQWAPLLTVTGHSLTRDWSIASSWVCAAVFGKMEFDGANVLLSLLSPLLLYHQSFFLLFTSSTSIKSPWRQHFFILFWAQLCLKCRCKSHDYLSS